MKHSAFLKSSVIVSAAYSNWRLLINFTSGKSICYDDVPWEVYRDLLNAESPGKYYNEHIKFHYRSERQ
ncbi:MAG: KTSC domain-containing protein [Eubacteriaceae bacterium]|jgi:hypothetical protein